MTIFKTNPVDLSEILKKADSGELQLPRFQRRWIWDSWRIGYLLASIAQNFPIGALMTIEMGRNVEYKKARMIEGTKKLDPEKYPSLLLLDGQQRITSLYQAIFSGKVVNTKKSPSDKQPNFKCWYYIDILEVIHEKNMENCIVRFSEDKQYIIGIDKGIKDSKERTDNFLHGRRKLLHKSDELKKENKGLAQPENEYATYMYPVNIIFNDVARGEWHSDFETYWDNYWNTYFSQHKLDSPEEKLKSKNKNKNDLFKFENEIIFTLHKYSIPVIQLSKDTKDEAMCLVFERVNQPPEPLTIYEIMVATYDRAAAYSEDEFDFDQFMEDSIKEINEDKLGTAIEKLDFLKVAALVHTYMRYNESKNEERPKTLKRDIKNLTEEIEKIRSEKKKLEKEERYLEQQRDDLEPKIKLGKEIGRHIEERRKLAKEIKIGGGDMTKKVGQMEELSKIIEEKRKKLGNEKKVTERREKLLKQEEEKKKEIENKEKEIENREKEIENKEKEIEKKETEKSEIEKHLSRQMSRHNTDIEHTQRAITNIPYKSFKDIHENVKNGFIEANVFLEENRLYRANKKIIILLCAFYTIAIHLFPQEYEENKDLVEKRILHWFWCNIFGGFCSNQYSNYNKVFSSEFEWIINGGKEVPYMLEQARKSTLDPECLRSNTNQGIKLGVELLLMQKGVKDFNLGKSVYDLHTKKDEQVNTHHIFPKSWCEQHGIDLRYSDSSINLTPLLAITNSDLGKEAPSIGLQKVIDKGKVVLQPGIHDAKSQLNDNLRSHLIEPEHLHKNDFESFRKTREKKLYQLIQEVWKELQEVWKEPVPENLEDMDLEDMDQ